MTLIFTENRDVPGKLKNSCFFSKKKSIFTKVFCRFFIGFFVREIVRKISVEQSGKKSPSFYAHIKKWEFKCIKLYRQLFLLRFTLYPTPTRHKRQKQRDAHCGFFKGTHLRGILTRKLRSGVMGVG